MARPVILLTFANDRYGPTTGYLRDLIGEQRAIKAALAQAPVEVVTQANITLDELYDLFNQHGDHLFAWHHGGHAESDALFLETSEGRPEAARIEGLAVRVGQLRRLALLVLNGCSTAGQVETLRAHCPAPIIATEQAILDAAARDFAERFYRDIAADRGIADAFASAASRVEATGGPTRMLRPAEPAPEGPPWTLHVDPQRPGSAAWRLSDTARHPLRDPRLWIVLAAVLAGLIWIAGSSSGPALTADGDADAISATADAMPEGFVEAPAGSFMMGSPDGEDGRQDDEGPQHRVTFSRPLWVQTHEVTQDEWERLMGTTPAFFDGCDDCPVERVNWYEAAAYANARSRAEGLAECYSLMGCGGGERGGGCSAAISGCDEETWRCAAVGFVGLACSGYRLPTEAEWAYVARAGTTTRFSSGDDEAALAQAGWYGANSENRTHPVGGKAANGWGLHDVHGNVREWCHDVHRRAYTPSAATDPLSPGSDGKRVYRGGSFRGTARDLRSAHRDGWLPWERTWEVGFRLVRSAPAP